MRHVSTTGLAGAALAGLLGFAAPTHGQCEISKIRAEQYASIAYSMRAILALRQESLLSEDAHLLALEAASLELPGLSIDRVTLSALMLAAGGRCRMSPARSPGQAFAASSRRPPESSRTHPDIGGTPVGSLACE